MDSVSSLRAAVTPILGELVIPLRSRASEERIVSSPFLGSSTWRLVLVVLFMLCASPILPLCVFLKTFQGRRTYARWPPLRHIGMRKVLDERTHPAYRFPPRCVLACPVVQPFCGIFACAEQILYPLRIEL